MSQHNFRPEFLQEKNPQLYQYLSKLLGAQYDSFVCAQAEPRSIRVNTLKCPHPEEFVRRLLENDFQLSEIGFAPHSYFLNKEPFPISHTLNYFRGDFAFQGASSQLPAQVLNPAPGEKVLDMAAAPGSKTTHLGQLMQNQGLVLANDMNRGRLQALNANMQRLGMLNGAISYMPGERLGRVYPEFFDKVLLDTPCSGLGTLGTHGEIAGWWSQEKMRKIALVQQQLFISAVKALKPGGEMVYSTCSVAPEENEAVIEAMLKDYPLEVLDIDKKRFPFAGAVSEYDGHTFNKELQKVLRVWPQQQAMEGFFVARLKKTGSYFSRPADAGAPFRPASTVDEAELARELDIVSDVWGIDPLVWKNNRYYMTQSRIYMLPRDCAELPVADVTNAGLLLAERRGRIWKLSHQALQHLGTAVTRRRLRLEEAQVKRLFGEGFLEYEAPGGGYWVLDVDDKPIAMLFYDGNMLRIRLPNLFALPDALLL